MKKFGKGALLSASALVSFVGMLPQAAMAQDAEPAAEEEGGLKEIVVTARRTQETLQDTPVAVSVVTSETIQAQGLNSLDDFAKLSTGISFSQAFGRFTDRPVIRGASNVLAGVQFGVETGAAYFVDGIYFQGDLQSFDPSSIERVEIVKGPQSALYGRNTYAGAINYITKDPTTDFNVSGRARLAQNDEVEGALTLSGPIIRDVLGFRAGIRYYDYGGEFRNNITGKKVGQENSKSVYATLVFTPHPDIKMRTRVSYQRDRDGTRAFFLQGASANNCFPGFRSPGFRNATTSPIGLNSTNRNQWFCGVLQPQPNNIFLNTDAASYALNGNTINAQDGTAYDGVFNSQISVSNTFDWDIAGTGWNLSILSGYRKNKNTSGSDSDHSFAFSTFGAPGEPLFTISDRDRQVDMSQEFKISSPSTEAVRVMVGGYVFTQGFWSQDYVFQDPVARTGRVLLPVGGPNSQYASILNRAMFGMVSWDITDALTISAELRHAIETKKLIERGTGVFAAGVTPELRTQFGCVTPSASCTIRGDAEFTGTDPRITINYKITDDLLVYANYATGRKPGGFNGTGGIVAASVLGREAPTYEQEKSKGFEIGMKFSALDNRLRGSIAAYRNDLTNVQLSTAIPGAVGSITSIVTTTADARTQGLEFELQAAPVDGLTLTGGISYVDAKFTKGCDADLFIYQSGGLRPNFNTAAPTAAGLALCDITGKRLPLGSPFTANASLSYETDLNSSMTGFFTSNMSYESEKNIQTDNLAKVGDTFLVNARLGIKTKNFSIAFFGRNLTNEDSVPLATRWFDLRYGSACRSDVPQFPSGTCPSTLARPIAPTTFDGRPAVAETGSPRGIFGALRKTRTFGIEGTFNF